jgi:16S rRNA U1498 N3-methylase RsmE
VINIDEIIRKGVELGVDEGQPYIKYTEAAVDDITAYITEREREAYKKGYIAKGIEELTK